MEGLHEEDVTSGSETPAAAYSPHTQGFPPSSHAYPSNPFSAKRPSWPEVKTAAPPTTSTFAVSFLRPSKLEAGLGSTIFTKQATASDSDVKNEDESKLKQKESLQAESSTTTTTAESESKDKKEPDSFKQTTEQEPTTGLSKLETTEKSKENGLAPATTEELKTEPFSYRAPTAPVGFVFGSNLNDRVENVSKGVANGDGHDKLEASRPGTSGSPEGGKRKWDTTVTTTGEENESNVMQTSCRLFALDASNSNWIERGRGQLRLNDRQEGEVLHSRVIVRTIGSMRLMLNTPVFPQMVIERPSEKCVKITAHDDGDGTGTGGKGKLFIIQCSPADAETLHSALEWRLRSIVTASTKSTNNDVEPPIARATEGEQTDGKSASEPETESSETSPPKKPKLSVSP